METKWKRNRNNGFYLTDVEGSHIVDVDSSRIIILSEGDGVDTNITNWSERTQI